MTLVPFDKVQAALRVCSCHGDVSVHSHAWELGYVLAVLGTCFVKWTPRVHNVADIAHLIVSGHILITCAAAFKLLLLGELRKEDDLFI